MFSSEHSNTDPNDRTNFAGIPPIIHSANLGAPTYGVARHLVLGDRLVLRLPIANLHKRGYAEPNHWSKPLPTGHEDEHMVILSKQLPLSYPPAQTKRG
jgi:hypothetical protein